jgi:heptosyltransferase-2/heptosyltransferase-3
VRHVWALDKRALPHFFSELAYYARIARENYDLVVDFQQLPRCRFVTLMSRAEVRLSYPPPWYNRLLYTHWTQPAPAYSAEYRVGILAPLGITWDGLPPEIFLTDAEKAWARDYLAGLGLAPGTFITLDPTHRRVTRLWPSRHYGTMIGLVHAARPDLRFLILYGRENGRWPLKCLLTARSPPPASSPKTSSACGRWRPCSPWPRCMSATARHPAISPWPWAHGP